LLSSSSLSLDRVGKRYYQPASTSSSDDSDGPDLEGYFDAEDEVGETDSGTNPTDIDTDIEGGSEADTSWIIDEDKDRPPEYYLNQEEDLNEYDDKERITQTTVCSSLMRSRNDGIGKYPLS
jgi:hypothetical protein